MNPLDTLPHGATAVSSPHDRISIGLAACVESFREQGIPVPPLEGKLLRPLFALSLVAEQEWDGLDTRFWSGVLAVQMAHEASLVHDDILDSASQRRGRATVSAECGVGEALVLGDHYLTASYRAAAGTRSPEYMALFAHCVERTVAGEVDQARTSGSRIDDAEYERIITGKSGELFGAAGGLGGALLDPEGLFKRVEIGRAFGAFYQRIDDLLDYCDAVDTGKEALQDYRQQKWSWVLDLAGIDSFEWEAEAVRDAIFRPAVPGCSPARWGLQRLNGMRDRILSDAADIGVATATLSELLSSCFEAARAAVEAQERTYARTAAPATDLEREAEAEVRTLALELGEPTNWSAYFGRHARTFHLASRLFPPAEGGRVAGLYAFCRFTDDLVDDPADDAPVEVLAARLDAWSRLTRAAFEGADTGIPVLDLVLRDAATREVSWRYPEALLEGVRMDLTVDRYASWADLERYTFGVAAAVGGWMTQLFGLHDPTLLDRAHALGHAMQLTNIARDVGEDWHRGRVYLPAELLSAHGLTEEDLRAMVEGATPIGDAYRAAVQELLARADTYYDQAWPGIRQLPTAFRRPVAAAATAYRGIHREIRRHDFDNLNQRAHTSTSRKLVLAGIGLFDARRTP